MEKSNYMYKGFDITKTCKKDKLRNEYSNPYGYNFYSSNKEELDISYNVTHTNQDNRQK